MREKTMKDQRPNRMPLIIITTVIILLTGIIGQRNVIYATADPVSTPATQTAPDPAGTQQIAAQPATQQTAAQPAVTPARSGIARFAGLFAYIPFGEGRTVNLSIDNVKGRDYLFLPSAVSTSGVTFHCNEGASVSFEDGTALTMDKPVDITSRLGADGGDGVRQLVLNATVAGVTNTYDVFVMQSANIPGIYITSADPAKGRSYIEANKSNKAEGSMTMMTSKGKVLYDGALTQIKGRGNTTFMAEKKPYQIKLKTATDLTQTGAVNTDKTWILLANAYDPTLIHNTTGLKMAKKMGINAPDCLPVDLYYDGSYRGNYLLCEKVMVAPGRVAITDLEEKNTEANPGKDLDKLATAVGANKYGDVFQYVTGMNSPASYKGGYLLELDDAYYKEERSYFITSTGSPFVIKSPENCSKEEMIFISEYVEEMVRAALNGGKEPDSGRSVWEYIDKDSFAKYFTLQEIVKNADSFSSSTYFYLNDDGKPMKAGPIWDLDDTYGIRTDVSGSEGFSSGGFIQPFLSLADFKRAVKTVYNNSGYAESSNPGIDIYSKEIAASQKMNRILWNDSKQMFTKLESYEADITAMKKFTAARSKWLKGIFATW